MNGAVFLDLLAFRPNPQNMMSAYDGDIADSDEQREKDEETTAEGIYRPPKLAPMPYTAAPSRKSERRPQADPSALTALLNADPTRPHLESSTGLGTTPSLSSSRAKAVQRYTEYEEENFTRLVMKKQDMKRRAREEEELLLGGSLGGRSRRGGGFEGEFADVLKDVGASKKISGGDPYEELRRKGRKADLMTRSRVRSRDEALQDFEEVSRPDKKTRFEKQTKAVRRKLAKVKK